MGKDLAGLLATLKDDGVETAHVGIFDLNGTFRERRLRLGDVDSVFDGGGTFVNVLRKWDIADTVYAPGPFVGEAVAVDPGSARPYPFEPNSALLVADFTGAARQQSAREVLRAQIARADAMGYAVRAAFEFEFIVLDMDATALRDDGFGRLKPFAAENRCWSGQSGAVYAEFLSELEAVLTAGGIAPFALGLELGPGCFETTLRATDPLRAADDAALFRLFTKAFCRRRGLTASFMAKLSAEFPGLSGHIHLSLVDKGTGDPLFHDAAGVDRMSPLFRSFVAGLTNHAAETHCLCAQTVNAYRRLAPGNWAPRTASWAVQNYAAAVRVVSEPEAMSRLEFRLPAADTNPHLALAMTLGLGLRGIETEAQLPPPIAGGGPDEAGGDGPALPHDLFEAADRLAASHAARETFGDGFIDHFVTACRAEEAALRQHVSAFERERYLEA